MLMACKSDIAHSMARALLKINALYGVNFLRLDLRRDQALECLHLLHAIYEFLGSKNEPALNDNLIFDNFHLDGLERFIWDCADFWGESLVREAGYFSDKYGAQWMQLSSPIKDFVQRINGYDTMRISRQLPEVADQYRFTVTQLARLCVKDRKYSCINNVKSLLDERRTMKAINEDTYHRRETLCR